PWRATEALPQDGQRTPSGQRCWRTSSKHFASSISDDRLIRVGEVMGSTAAHGKAPPQPPSASILTLRPTTPDPDKSVHLYDILFEGETDLRPLPFTARRARLEAFCAREQPPRMDVSPLVPMAALEDLDRLRQGVRGTPVEGLML